MSIKPLLPLQGHPRRRLWRRQQRLPRLFEVLLGRRWQAVHVVDHLLLGLVVVRSDGAVHVLLRDPVVRVLHRVALWRPLTSSLAASTSSWAHLRTAGPSLQVTTLLELGKDHLSLSFTPIASARLFKLGEAWTLIIVPAPETLLQGAWGPVSPCRIRGISRLLSETYMYSSELLDC